MSKWEYKTKKVFTEYNNLSERELNELGAKGWELVSIHRIKVDKINWCHSGKAAHVYFFKRLYKNG